jgi:hypothetical protein
MAKLILEKRNNKLQSNDQKTFEKFVMSEQEFKEAVENSVALGYDTVFKVAKKKQLWLNDEKNMTITPVLIVHTKKNGYKMYCDDGTRRGMSMLSPEGRQYFTSKKEARAELAEVAKTKLKENFNETVKEVEEKIEPVTNAMKGYATIAGALLGEFKDKTKKKVTEAIGLDDAEKKDDAEAKLDNISQRFKKISQNILDSNKEIAAISRDIKDLFSIIGKKS